jgi:hypothetical protein
MQSVGAADLFLGTEIRDREGSSNERPTPETHHRVPHEGGRRLAVVRMTALLVIVHLRITGGKGIGAIPDFR